MLSQYFPFCGRSKFGNCIVYDHESSTALSIRLVVAVANFANPMVHYFPFCHGIWMLLSKPEFIVLS